MLVGCRSTSPDARPTKQAGQEEPATRSQPNGNPAVPRRIHPPYGVIYQGPGGLEGWISDGSDERNWRYSDGALWTRSSSWIGRDVHLPERSCIEFTLSNPGGIRAFFVGLYTHVPLKVTYTPEYHVANYYTLSIFPDTLLFQRLNAGGHDQYLGKETNPYSTPHPMTRVKILADKPSKKFRIFFDGTQVAQWQDPEPFAGEGTGITFQAFAQDQELAVSDIKVSVWNGEP